MADKMKIISEVCLSFCPYYKPEKDDNLACGGFLAIERLYERGKDVAFNGAQGIPDEATRKKLLQALCPACPYYEEDCDFVFKKEGALPCGGFKLLGLLLEKGIISVNDIKG